MRSFEVITSGVNRSDGRLQPTLGAALMRRAFVCYPDDSDVVVAKVNRFGFAGRRFKQSVHIFAPGLKSSRNHNALLSAKLNQVNLDGKPQNPSGLAFAADAVNARDPFTKGQGFLPAIGFHGLKCKPGNHAGAMGCSPHLRFSWIQPRYNCPGWRSIHWTLDRGLESS
jgi:hypothetical protein